LLRHRLWHVATLPIVITALAAIAIFGAVAR
jgi:hypothetical protein